MKYKRRPGMKQARKIGRHAKAVKNARTPEEADAIAKQLYGAKAGPEMAKAVRAGCFEPANLKSSLRGPGINKAAAATRTPAEKAAIRSNRTKVLLEPLGKELLDEQEEER